MFKNTRYIVFGVVFGYAGSFLILKLKKKFFNYKGKEKEIIEETQKELEEDENT